MMIRDSTFHGRMADLSRRMPPPPGSECFEALAKLVRRDAETDISFRREVGDLLRKAPSFRFTRMFGGSGLLMAATLRDYFNDVLRRWWVHGPYSLASSFNVVEAFLNYRDEYCAFDLRQEREHLLRSDDFFEWYTSNGIPDDAGILRHALEDGCIYSFDMTVDDASFRLSTAKSDLLILGVSLIRRGSELSTILVCGENPPNPSDEEVTLELQRALELTPTEGHEGVGPSDDLGIPDRYLSDLRDYARVVLLSRFDIGTKQYAVRSINLDCGPSYRVLTDDASVLSRKTSDEDRRCIVELAQEAFDRYAELLSAGTALMYIPLAFADLAAHVTDSTFLTELQAPDHEARVSEARAELQAEEIPLERKVRCLLPRSFERPTGMRRLPAPPVAQVAEGHWRPLPPGEIGEDQKGRAVVGRTWVRRIESWTSETASSFLLSRTQLRINGPCPGTVYIARTPSHGPDIYKVGSTTRNPAQRAQELGSATGVPLPFEIVASWDVGDCAAVEREVHRRLDHCRINPRREFFCAGLPQIVSTLENVLSDLATANR